MQDGSGSNGPSIVDHKRLRRLGFTANFPLAFLKPMDFALLTSAYFMRVKVGRSKIREKFGAHKIPTRDSPFLIVIGVYGGGGYDGVCALAAAIEYLEAAFEYGTITAFDFGAVTGQVSTTHKLNFACRRPRSTVRRAG